MSLLDCARSAASTLRLFEEGASHLIPFGWSAIDAALGGDEPGQVSVLAGQTGLGKSRAVLTAIAATGDGLVSMEDGTAAIGARMLAERTGIDSLRIRRKDLTKAELARLRLLLESAPAGQRGPYVVDCVAGTLEQACAGVRSLARMGCRRAWVDYLQKFRGLSDDRRGEIGRVLGTLQRTAYEEGVALGLVSQFRRMVDRNGQPLPRHARPNRFWLKESGDIENEARTILFLYGRAEGSADLLLDVDKASYGGEGTTTILRPDASGVLREVSEEEGEL